MRASSWPPVKLTRADRRWLWRLYISGHHTYWPRYQMPSHRPSWPERTWIRLFG